MNDNISLEIEELEDELDELNMALLSNNKNKLFKKIANVAVICSNILLLLGFYGKMPASYLMMVNLTLTSVMEIGAVCIYGSSIENKKENERIVNNINEKNNELLQAKNELTKSSKKVNDKCKIININNYKTFSKNRYKDADGFQINDNLEKAKVLKKINKTPRN